MKTRLKTCLFSAALILPMVASAHPGHLPLDPGAGLPHAGHELEIAPFLLLPLCALAAWRWFRASR